MKRIILAITCLLIISSNVLAQRLAEKDSLKDIKEFSVVVEDIEPSIEKLGLSKSQIQTDVELRLRKAGIKILTPSKPNETKLPELYIQVMADTRDSALYYYDIKVEVMTAVFLECQTPKFTIATIWGVDSIGSVGRDKIREIREGINDRVSEFLNDYLTVNPK